MPKEEEDLVNIDEPLNPGDEYSPDDYWAELSYCEFESHWDQMKHDIYNFNHYGHEDGPEAYAAECFAEECLAQEIEVGGDINNYDEMSAEDMERDSQLELQAMCDAAVAQEAYFKCTL